MLRRSFVLALAPVAALAAVAPTGSASVSARDATLISFADPAGDTGAAADITNVELRTDAVTGDLVFWVALANRPDDLASGDGLIVYLDADRNPATGDEGTDYAIVADVESAGLSRWDGSEYAPVDAVSLGSGFVTSRHAVRIAIHPNDLGGTTAFDFALETSFGDDVDAAPDAPPNWSYAPVAGRLELTLAGSSLAPKKPVAGKSLIARIRVVRHDLDEVLTLGKVRCTLRVGKKAVRSTRSGFAANVAFCSWKLPRAAAGKTVRGTIALSYGGVTVKRSFSARAR